MRYTLFFCLLFFSNYTFSEEGHKHEGGDEHEEASVNVGPDKGIIEKSETDGIKLSKEAVETMLIKTIDVSSQQISISDAAIVKIKDEKYIYRLRNGWFKRSEIQVIQKNGKTLIVKISDFKIGDKIVVEGLGFIRTSEIFSEEGATHSH